MSDPKKAPASYKKPALIAAAVLLFAVFAYQNPHLFARPFRPAQVAGDGALAPSASVVGTGVAPPPGPKQAGPAEFALVAPLKAGSALLDYTVAAVYGVEDGSVWVLCSKDKGLIYLEITLAADGGPLAPQSAGPYAVYVSAREAPPGDIERLTNAFIEILKVNQGAPVPAGLKTTSMPKTLPHPPVPR